MQFKHQVHHLLKTYTPKRYTAWEIAALFDVPLRERRVLDILMKLSRDYARIRFERKKGKKEVYFYYEGDGKEDGTSGSL